MFVSKSGVFWIRVVSAFALMSGIMRSVASCQDVSAEYLIRDLTRHLQMIHESRVQLEKTIVDVLGRNDADRSLEAAIVKEMAIIAAGNFQLWKCHVLVVRNISFRAPVVDVGMQDNMQIYPAVVALGNFGVRSIPAIVDELDQAKSTHELRLLGYALMRIENDKSLAKARLQALVDAYERPKSDDGIVVRRREIQLKNMKQIIEMMEKPEFGSPLEVRYGIKEQERR